MKKVLQISMGETYGGIERLEESFKNNIKNFQVDVLTPTKIFDDNNYYDLNISRNSFLEKIKYNHRLSKFLKNNHYDIVHINSSVFLFSYQVARIAKKNNSKVIAHYHSIPKVSKLKSIIIKILMPFYKKKIDIFLSCSKEASFTNDSTIIKNGIDIEKYKYNEKIREEYRNKLNIKDKKVYGHIGRFDTNKNHDFLIDVFYEIQKKEKNSILLLIGEGESISKIKDKVNNLNINDKVIFLGSRNDTYNLLNAMDIFIFPSIKEGLGLSIIESLTSGLPTYVSNGIPEEANISNNFHRINDFNTNNWVKIILKDKKSKRNNSYKDTINSGYDIKESTKELEKIYKDLI